MTKRLGRTMPIVLVFALLLLLAGALFGVEPTYAASALDFVIRADDPTHWELLSGGEVIETYVGDFFDYDSTDAASVAFYDKIGEVLESLGIEGRDGYTLRFELAPFEAQCHGGDSVEYSEIRHGNVYLDADVELYFSKTQSAATRSYLQYRSANGDAYLRQGSARETGDPIFFGQAVDVGAYSVRYTVEEGFEFDGRQYTVERHSNEFVIDIVAVPAPMPEIGTVEITYGTPYADIANHIGILGKFTLSEQQDEGFDPTAFLKVEDGEKTMYFDFESNNKNYLPLAHVPVTVKATPRRITVSVGDAFSRIGEPQADLNEVPRFVAGLAEGDDVDDLGLELYIENFDVNRAGQYIILARVSNPNYSVVTTSYEGWPISGGRYMLYLYRFDVDASDGTHFVIYCDEFANVSVRVEVRDIAVSVLGDTPEGAKSLTYKSVKIYTFIFEDGGGRRYPTQGFVVEWEGELVGAHYAFATGDNVADTLSDIAPTEGVKQFAFKANYDTVVLFETVVEYFPENIWQWYNILLLALDAALMVVATALAIALSRQRRASIW